MSSSNCCFLTCIQISQETGPVVWYSHLFQNFPQCIVIHTVKVFGIVNKAEVDVFFELSCFFDNPTDVGNLISGSSVFSKSSLNSWKFTVHVLLKPGLENFEHYFTSVWDGYNCAVVWAFFGIAFLWDWNENWLFLVLWPLLIFQICWHIECSSFTASSFRVWNSSTIWQTVKLNITDKLTIKWGRVWVSCKTKGWSIEEGFSRLPISTSPFPFFDGLSVFVNRIQIFFVR